MILKGSQRGHAAHLARHLMNARDNEHVALHELRGFVAEELEGALREAEALAKGTRCRQFLFSLSLSPPEHESVSTQSFETAIEMAEAKLGLEGQPRAIVFHEKEGRRHAHAVWSRIDAETMTAKNLPFFKTRLMEVSKELYLAHGWDMPRGLIERDYRNPLNFTREEWQQAKRVKQDPRLLKAMFRECWRRSGDGPSLESALEERGFTLARGDRRAVVALDYRGEVYALARWAGVKAKELRARLGDAKDLPTLEEAKGKIAARMSHKLRTYVQEVEAGYRRLDPSIEFRRQQMTSRHRQERKTLEDTQQARWDQETKARAARLPRGLGGLWSRITGRYGKIRRQNEYDAWQSTLRDTAEKDALITRQLEERQHLQKAIQRMRERQSREIGELQAEIAAYLQMRKTEIPKVREFNERAKVKEYNICQRHHRAPENYEL